MRCLTLVAMLILSISCTSAQKNWRQNLSVDFSVDGDNSNTRKVYQSVGISYPLWFGSWASTGMWTDAFETTGAYWGISYSIAPFDLFK